MSHWIYSALVGLACGLIARFVLPGHDSMGLIMTMLVGVIGAYVGTGLGHVTGMLDKSKAGGWIASIAGSVVILLVLRMI